MSELKRRTEEIVYLHPDEIHERWNAREDYGEIDTLSQSIEIDGVKEPIKVFIDNDEDGNEVYYLTDGHRRHAAALEAMNRTGSVIYIPSIIEPRGRGNADRMLDQIIFNDGKPLSSFEIGKAAAQANGYGYSIQEIANKTGKTVTMIYNYINVNNAVPALRNALKNEEISFSAALEIVRRSKDHDMQLKYLKEAQRNVGDGPHESHEDEQTQSMGENQAEDSNQEPQNENNGSPESKSQSSNRKKKTKVTQKAAQEATGAKKKGRFNLLKDRLEQKVSTDKIPEQKRETLEKVVEYENNQINFKDLVTFFMSE